MEALVSLLVFSQALGALTGTSAAVLGEYFYIKAVRDGKIDAAERFHLRTASQGVRYGMTLIVITSFALVITDYLREVPVQPALRVEYWIYSTLVLLVIGFSWALSRGHVSFALGSAVTLSGWIFITYLSFAREPLLSFGSTVALFIIATAVLYAVLHYARIAFTVHSNVMV